MSLLEWLSERGSPGPLGTVEFGAPGPGHWNPSVVILRGVVAAAILSGAIDWLLSAIDSSGDFVLAIALIVVYCVVAYWFTPRPDYCNVGLFGGLVDHPFRWSDDYNRWLIALGAVLLPGRFVTVSLRDVLRLARGQRTLVLPPRDEHTR